MITQDRLCRSTALPAAGPAQAVLLTACYVAGGTWLLAWGREGAVWVDVTAYRADAAPEEARITALARTLLLAEETQERRLCPHDVAWLLADPRRAAWLIDLVAAAEDALRMHTTPLRVLLTPRGQVRWQFTADVPKRPAVVVPSTLIPASPRRVLGRAPCPGPFAQRTRANNGRARHLRRGRHRQRETS